LSRNLRRSETTLVGCGAGCVVVGGGVLVVVVAGGRLVGADGEALDGAPACELPPRRLRAAAWLDPGAELKWALQPGAGAIAQISHPVAIGYAGRMCEIVSYRAVAAAA
jgi:hypothetical protein